MNTDIKRYRDNLRDELNGAAFYTALAEAERDPVRKDLLLQVCAKGRKNRMELALPSPLKPKQISRALWANA